MRKGEKVAVENQGWRNSSTKNIYESDNSLIFDELLFLDLLFVVKTNGQLFMMFYQLKQHN